MISTVARVQRSRPSLSLWCRKTTIIPCGHAAKAASSAAAFSVGASQYARNSSIWSSLIPKSLRSPRPDPPGATASSSAASKRGWNPAAIFIVLFLLVGSNAINLKTIRNELESDKRVSETRIRQLAEAIQRVQNGEEVDLAALLGSGDPQAEEEWEQVLKDIEDEDRIEPAPSANNARGAAPDAHNARAAQPDSPDRPARFF